MAIGIISFPYSLCCFDRKSFTGSMETYFVQVWRLNYRENFILTECNNNS